MIETDPPMNNIYIGIMSGTSVDAIDLVAITIKGNHFNIVGATSIKFPNHLRTKILKITRDSKAREPEEITELDYNLGVEYSNAVNQLLKIYRIKKSEVEAIGLHGQTIGHFPNAKIPRSIQIGDADLVSSRTGLKCIANFRGADIAAGGQGAPLSPIFHSWLFRMPNKNRSVINIGGISNISILDDQPLRGHDLGPGNVLLDSWIQAHAIANYDKDGRWARQGQTDEYLLNSFLNDDFLNMGPPKSTGSDYFNLDWIKTKLKKSQRNIAPQNVQSTLTELSARIISDYLNSLSSINEAAVCGGGSKNEYLIERIKKLYQGKLFKTEEWGMDSQWVEASGFAYLAYLRLKEQALDLSSITGSRKKVRLGEIHSP